MAGVRTAPPLTRSRKLARFLICLLVAVLCVLCYTVGRPVYWHIYATVIRPFDSGRESSSHGDSQPTLQPVKHDAASLTPGSAATAPPNTRAAKPGQKGTSDFNPEDPKFLLTKERAHSIAPDGYLLVTWSNHHYIDFVRSWLWNVDKAGISAFIVGAMDDVILRELDKVKVNTWRLKTGLSTGDFGWGSPQFRKMGRCKINLIRDTIALELNIIISDVDVMWMRNPVPFFQRYPDVDLLTSSDHIRNSREGESLEGFETVHSTANIGIMMFRPSALPLADAWVKMVDSQDIWDQQAFNDPRLFRANMRPVENDTRGVFYAFDGKMKMGIMPVALFAGGHTFYVQRLAHTLGMVPYAAHATFQYSGTWGKRHRMREAGLFYDLPTYFEHPVGFIAFQFDLSPELLANSAPDPNKPFNAESLKGHFRLIHHQYKRLRSAFALATLTGRAVIIPAFWCGSDKFWGPIDKGRIGGSSEFKLPFQCPLDHVLRLENGIFGPPMNNTQEFGPVIEIREHSFLSRVNTPPSLLETAVQVEMCTGKGGKDCSNGRGHAKIEGGRIKLQAGLSSKQLTLALGAAAGSKLWNFTTMEGIMEGPRLWDDKAAWDKFEKRLRLYSETFCCIHENPGHYWYDFLFDLPNHQDRFNRKFRGEPDEWIKYRGDLTVP